MDQRWRWTRAMAAAGSTLLALVVATPLAAATVVIDAFSTDQSLSGQTTGHVNGGADIIGVERFAQLGANGAATGTLTVTGGQLTFSSGANLADLTLFYDGDNDGGGSQTGLGGVDLTGGGTNNGVRISAASSTATYFVSLTIETNANAASCGFVQITGAGNFDIPFASLGTCDDGPANLASVGRILVAAFSFEEATMVLNGIEAAAGVPVELQGFAVE